MSLRGGSHALSARAGRRPAPFQLTSRAGKRERLAVSRTELPHNEAETHPQQRNIEGENEPSDAGRNVAIVGFMKHLPTRERQNLLRTLSSWRIASLNLAETAVCCRRAKSECGWRVGARRLWVHIAAWQR